MTDFYGMDPAVIHIGLVMLLCESVGTSETQGPVSVCAEHDYYRVLTSSSSFLDRNCDDRFDMTMTPVRKRESYDRDPLHDIKRSAPAKKNSSARPKKKLKGSKSQRKKRKKKRLQEAVRLKKKRKPNV